MIIDLPRFIDAERPVWTELERLLDKLETDSSFRMDLQQVQRFHYLYQRVLSDLARIATFSAEPEIRHYLESLTARAYGEMHETRESVVRLKPLQWFTVDFPRVFRKHIQAFWVSCVVTLIGMLFGAGILAVDQDAKVILVPAMFSHLYQSPTERVKQEEQAKEDRSGGRHASFSSWLMTHNIKASILALSYGVTYGIGTIVLLFTNGVSLGAIAFDYIQDGQILFLLGWLLPHGVIEIPSFLIAGQGGLLLGRSLLGRGDRNPLSVRLRQIRADLAFLIFGASVMLVWAGLVESFLSQYHQPVIPYTLKIGFGIIELILLVWFLASSGRKEKP